VTFSWKLAPGWGLHLHHTLPEVDALVHLPGYEHQNHRLAALSRRLGVRQQYEAGPRTNGSNLRVVRMRRERRAYARGASTFRPGPPAAPGGGGRASTHGRPLQSGGMDETCPVSTEGWTRRVHFVRERGGGGAVPTRQPPGSGGLTTSTFDRSFVVVGGEIVPQRLPAESPPPAPADKTHARTSFTTPRSVASAPPPLPTVAPTHVPTVHSLC